MAIRRKAAFALMMAAMTLGLSAGPAAASQIHTFTFTGADLLNNVFVNGADGSTAADNDLYAGARKLHVTASDIHADVGSTYQQSQHNNFIQRWDQYAADNYVLDEFHLWGLNDDRTAEWGEDYKPFRWVSLDGPAGWTTELSPWSASWGDVPDGHHTDVYPRWIGGPDHGLRLDATTAELEAEVFTATIEFDPTDAWWSTDTQGEGSADAPNSLDDVLTMWFSSFVTQYDEDDNFAAYHVYEGNLAAENTSDPDATLAPSPAAATAGLLGMLTLLVMRRRIRSPAALPR